MEKYKVALLMLFLALIFSSGCVNRYSDCTGGIIDPADPLYTCCVRPGETIPDPNPNSRDCCPGTEQEVIPNTAPQQFKCVLTLQSYWGAWQYAALLAVLISAFLVSLAYMTGSIFSNQMLIAWAKNELYQVMASAFILGCFIGILFMVQAGIAGELEDAGVPCAGTDCHILLANRYLEVMYDDSAIMARSIIRVNSVLMFFRHFGVTAELLVQPYFGIVLSPAAGLGIPAESLKNTMDVLIKIMMLIKAQQIALGLIKDGLFPVLLVMGLVFRTFFFTRKLGGLLIAVAVGMYLVYPLVFVLAHNIWLDSIHTQTKSDGTPIGSYILKANVSGNLTYLIYPNYDSGTGQTDRLLKIRSNLTGLRKSLGEIVTGNFIIGEGGFIEKTSILLVYTTFIPFVALMTTIGFVRGLSSVLGGDIEIAGLTRIL